VRPSSPLTTRAAVESGELFTLYTIGMLVIDTRCCSYLCDGNNDQNEQVETVVDLNEAASPRLTGIPLVFMIKAELNTFSVPAQAPSGKTLSYTISTSQQSLMPTPSPVGLSLNPTTGLISWTPGEPTVDKAYPNGVAGEKLYAFQVMITVPGTNLRTAMDWIFRVAPRSSLPFPTIAINPSTNPVIAFYGAEVSFQVIANSQTARVLVSSNSLPSGSLFQPCAEGADGSGFAPGGACTRTFRWTPQLGQQNVDLIFVASDSNNLDSPALRVTIQLGNAKYIYLSGIVRNMVGHTDFNKNVATGDTAIKIISSTLSTTAKPIYAPTGTPTTIASASSFNQWWNTIPGVNTETVFSVTLSNVINGQLSPGGILFNFVSGAFFPITSGNPFYSYELHTYITYKGVPQEVFSYKVGELAKHIFWYLSPLTL